MEEPAVKDKILEQFSKSRKDPNAYFEESHFLDYLTSPEHRKDSVKNSFKGVRAYYRFMNALELEFGICFTLPDLDKYYSVDTLTKKVIERISKRPGNLMILKQRNTENERYFFEIGLILILIGVYAWLGIHLVTIVTAIVIGIIIYWIVSSKIHNRNHNKRLTIRMHSIKDVA
ncbi:hypothetical protein [Pedobacter nyackensis]|uniref:hypothetical protein n=1 Tax=Pedobacter nyackensis TaxID=475255 RepID=UPI00292E783B|nr:hypothetical protein [Pedobacter nyackensis]